MSVKQLSLEDAASANIIVTSGTSKGNQAVHDLIVAYRANRRTGSACTKTRGEFSTYLRRWWRSIRTSPT